MNSVRWYVAQGTFLVGDRIHNHSGAVKVMSAETEPYPAVNSFDGMRMGVERVVETYGSLGVLCRMDIREVAAR